MTRKYKIKKKTILRGYKVSQKLEKSSFYFTNNKNMS